MLTDALDLALDWGQYSCLSHAQVPENHVTVRYEGMSFEYGLCNSVVWHLIVQELQVSVPVRSELSSPCLALTHV